MTIKIISFLLAALLFAMPSCGSSDAIRKARSTTHVIREETIVDGVKCSATAIAPNALLTASHCELPTDTITVDDHVASVLGIIRDGNDHTIYLLDVTFAQYASFGQHIEIGDDIFLFGNPAKFTDLFRRGTVAGVRTVGGGGGLLEELFGSDDNVKPSAFEFFYDFNGWPGDSGAGVFNQAGEIVGVVSVGELISAKDDSPWPTLKIMGGYSFAFTPEQFKKAADFRAPVKAKPPVKMGSFSQLLRRF